MKPDCNLEIESGREGQGADISFVQQTFASKTEFFLTTTIMPFADTTLRFSVAM